MTSVSMDSFSLLPTNMAIIKSLHPSLPLPPTIPSFPSCWWNREARQGWVKRMSGDVRASVVADEMKLSEAMLSAPTPSIKGIFVSTPPLCLSSVALLNYMASTLLPLLSVAWRGYTVRMHRAKFWHSALETMLCCDLQLKTCVQGHVSQDQESSHKLSDWK